MAYKDSDELKDNERYPLGDYSFRIERTSVPGSSNDKIEAICTDKDGKNARKSIQVPSSTEMLGWYVEANETEATVYCTIKKPDREEGEATDERYPGVTVPVSGSASYASGKYQLYASGATYVNVGGTIIACSASQGTYNYQSYGYPGPTIHDNVRTFYYHRVIDGKEVYFDNIDAVHDKVFSPAPVSGTSDWGIAAWIAIYGNVTPEGEGETTTVMVGRFAIDIEDAGGDGPGSDWIDPGDYDPDWEEGDPTHTLYVEVTGALSGRHNDPIVDPSYSYIPADKETVKDYGCGGDGGHGGGGGAGASTVVIHKFATNQANSKEVTAIARRHGYGSGGGKGGKGGDGCILVYY